MHRGRANRRANAGAEIRLPDGRSISEAAQHAMLGWVGSGRPPTRTFSSCDPRYAGSWERRQARLDYLTAFERRMTRHLALAGRRRVVASSTSVDHARRHLQEIHDHNSGPRSQAGLQASTPESRELESRAEALAESALRYALANQAISGGFRVDLLGRDGRRRAAYSALMQQDSGVQQSLSCTGEELHAHLIDECLAGFIISRNLAAA